jgi:hypothetical protein
MNRTRVALATTLIGLTLTLGSSTSTLAGQGDIQAPRGQDTERPRGQDTERPRGQDTERPRGQDTERPAGQAR